MKTDRPPLSASTDDAVRAHLIQELASVLSRAFIRLTRIAPNNAASDAGEPRKELDVSTTESPHDVDGTGPGGPPWKAT